jgi:Spy/CpxP family protein refolding chaperone
MRGNLRRLAILFSVVLNLAFLGTYFYREVPGWERIRNGFQSHLPYEALQLTEAQQRAFEPLRDAFHARLRQIGGELRREQLHLLDVLARPDQDLSSVRAAQERIRELQRVIQDAVIEHLREQNAIFTPAQRTRFFQVLRERIQGADLASPPWLAPDGKADPRCPFSADPERRTPPKEGLERR